MSWHLFIMLITLHRLSLRYTKLKYKKYILLWKNINLAYIKIATLWTVIGLIKFYVIFILHNFWNNQNYQIIYHSSSFSPGYTFTCSFCSRLIISHFIPNSMFLILLFKGHDKCSNINTYCNALSKTIRARHLKIQK